MKRDVLVLNDSGKLALKSGDQVTEIRPANNNVVLLVDTSGSMAGAKIEQVRDGAVQFAFSAADKGFQTGVLVFGDRAAVVLGPTSDRSAIKRKIRALDVGIVGGTTNLTAGLQICLKVPRLSTVVVVTDGMPNDQQSALEVATVLKATGVEILVIGTDDADTDFLGRLASRPDLALHVSANQLSSSINDASRMLSAGGITQLPTSKR